MTKRYRDVAKGRCIASNCLSDKPRWRYLLFGVRDGRLSGGLCQGIRIAVRINETIYPITLTLDDTWTAYTGSLNLDTLISE